MADEQVIISVNYDTSEAVNNINDLTDSIVGLEDEQKRLKKALKDGTITQEQYSQALEENRGQLTKNKALRKDNIKIIQSEAKSIDNLKAQNAALTKERNKLNLATETGIQRAKEINSTIDQNNDVIKKSSSEFEKNKINIGNYTSATEGLGEALNQLAPGFGAATQGGKGLLGIFRKLMANPFLLIVGAIAAALKLMFDVLKRTQGGQDKFAEKWTQLKAIFDVIIGRMVRLAKAAFKFIKGDLKGAAEEATAAFTGIKDEIIAVAAAAKKIAQLRVEIRKLTIANTEAVAELNKLSEIQRAIAGDSTRSLQEQLEASEKARKSSEKAAKQQAMLAKANFQLIEMENKLKKDQGILTDELRQNQADLYVASIEAEQNLLVLQVNNQKEREEIRRDFFEQELDFLIDAFDVQKTVNERIINDDQIAFDKRKALLTETQQLTESAFQEQIKSVEDYTGVKLDSDALIQESDARVLKDNINALGLNEITNNRLLEIIKERRIAVQDLNELERDVSNEKISRDQAANEKIAQLDYEKRLNEAETLEEQKTIEIERENEYFQRQIENKNLLDSEIEAMEAEHKMRMLGIEADYQEKVQEEQDVKTEEKEASEKESEDNKTAFKQQALVQGKQILDAGLDFLSTNLEAKKQKELSNENLTEEQREKIEKKYAKKRQRIAITEALISTGLAVLNALSQKPFIPFGLASSVTAGIIGGVQVAKIRKQTFADGGEVKSGIFGGLPHSMGGTKGTFSDGTNVEVERDEGFFIMKKDATAQINALSDINQAYGGNSFGSKSRYLQDGGEVETNAQMDIQKALQSTNITVKVEDITTGIEDRNNVLSAGVLE